MITNIDIMRSVNYALMKEFEQDEKVYEITNDDQVEEVKNGIFFVDVQEIYSKSRLHYSEDLVHVAITYTDVKTISKVEMLEMKQRLKDVFDLDLDIVDKEGKVIGNMIIDDRNFLDDRDNSNSFSMTLIFEFLNGKRKEKDYDKKGKANMELLHYTDNKQSVVINK